MDQDNKIPGVPEKAAKIEKRPANGHREGDRMRKLRKDEK